MSETLPVTGEQHPANLEALQEQLEQIAAKVKRSDKPQAKSQEDVQGPMLVIRGK